jgi:hypothetical protein
MNLKDVSLNVMQLLIGEPDEWSRETPSCALERTTSNGRLLFEQLWQQFPQVKDEVIFLKWSKQLDDVYAVRDVAKGGFVIQVDPDLDYLIVWDAVAQGEYGEWNPGDNPVGDALSHLREIIQSR